MVNASLEKGSVYRFRLQSLARRYRFDAPAPELGRVRSSFALVGSHRGHEGADFGCACLTAMLTLEPSSQLVFCKWEALCRWFQWGRRRRIVTSLMIGL